MMDYSQPNWVYAGDVNDIPAYYDDRPPIYRVNTEQDRWVDLSRSRFSAIPMPTEGQCAKCGYWDIRNLKVQEALLARGCMALSQQESVVGCVVTNTRYVNQFSAKHHELKRESHKVRHIA